jgi:hypothetical protein
MEAWSEYEHSRQNRPAAEAALAKRKMRPSIAALPSRMGLRGNPLAAAGHAEATLGLAQLRRLSWLPQRWIS